VGKVTTGKAIATDTKTIRVEASSPLEDLLVPRSSKLSCQAISYPRRADVETALVVGFNTRNSHT
jgi:hypothetical protein